LLPGHHVRRRAGVLPLRRDRDVEGWGAPGRDVELAVRGWYGEAAGPQGKRIVPVENDRQWRQRMGVHRLLSASEVAVTREPRARIPAFSETRSSLARCRVHARRPPPRR